MSKVEKKELTDLIDAVREFVSTLPDEADLTRAWSAYDKMVEDEKQPKSELDELMNQWKTTRPSSDVGLDFGGYGDDGCPYCGAKPKEEQ